MYNVKAAVSIHAPRVGRDFDGMQAAVGRFLFQFTRPAWGATEVTLSGESIQSVSIHAPRVGRDTSPQTVTPYRQVSIHAPRVGRDDVCENVCRFWRVSIHAPRVGRDAVGPVTMKLKRVSIHAPRVGRDYHACSFSPAAATFQFTRPAWGATSLSG